MILPLAAGTEPYRQIGFHGGLVRVVLGVLVAVLVAVLVSAVLPNTVPGAAAEQAADLPGAAYTPLASPTRVLDTRTALGGHPRPLGAGETITVDVPGLPADATAVVVNLTGTNGTASTYLSAFPNQFAGTSTLNLGAGQTAAASAFVTLGPDNTIRILNRNGTVDVVADLVGYLATSTGATFTSATSPTRVLDTRTTVGGHRGSVGPNEQLTLRVRGAGGVPANATAVVVNLTGVGPTTNSHLVVTPDGRTGTSALNLTRGETRANLAVVGIGGDGAIRIRNSAGHVHVLADVQGWFAPGSGGRYVALPAPERVLDTRQDGGPLDGRTTRTVSFADAGVPADDRVAVLFGLTGVRASNDTYLTAWPSGRARPNASNVNLGAGETVANAAISATPELSVFNNYGRTDVLVDVAGYFYTPSSSNPTAPGAPAVTRVYDAGDRVGVEWTAPADDGGLPITGFTVTARPGGLDVALDGDRRRIELAGLHPDVDYRITVTATNHAGTSPPSAESALVSPSAMTRIDTDETGFPDQAAHASFEQLSGNGRYAVLWSRSDSYLVPQPHRKFTDEEYLLRKDLQTGEIVLAGARPDGSALHANRQMAISWDGQTVAYASNSYDIGSPPSTLYVHDLVARTVRVIATAPADTIPADLTLSRDARWFSWVSRPQSGEQAVYRHDLLAGRTETVLACPDSTCGLFSEDTALDGRTFLIDYRPAGGSGFQPTLVDADTGALRALPADGYGLGYTLSGDGRWVFYAVGSGCPSCGDGGFALKKVSTSPGSTPVTLRTWTSPTLWSVAPSSVSHDGSLIGFLRQTGEGGQWYGAAPGFLFDQATGREILMPAPRSDAYVRAPVISSDGGLAVLQEGCFWGESCEPIGEYLISLPELPSATSEPR
ncbi:fibronectin type III domain-containing protein [Actinophytocola gossypii]|uniref:Fibronectin type III domain-containing protein n=1 Tax=Actinophytocola gossypii TaxID=2812003 RepID=A0ABT2JC86_9PSEU|nr:fibronectin type III domain-containing protein [Actinophytocola gossypii]MCT2585487.1 fibronectin type III domain-containing protein [Actinophytocola gossypii]